MVIKNIEKEIPVGMATEYSQRIKESAIKYINENKRTKTPILKHLKSIIDSFEREILGNMVGLEMYCIYHIEIEVNKFKIHFVKVNIDNSNLDNIVINGGATGSVGGEILNFNKNYIKFLHKLNQDKPLTEDTWKHEIATFSRQVNNQFKELKKLGIGKRKNG